MKKWILMSVLVGILTAGAGCNIGGEQSSSSVKTPPTSESSAIVSLEETSIDSIENSVENSAESSVETSVEGSDSVLENSSEETPEIQYYTVTFDTDGGNEIAPVQVKEGDKVTMPEPPKKSSMEAEYEFIGWYYGETEWDFENGTVTQDMVLTAKWKTLELYTPPFLPKD